MILPVSLTAANYANDANRRSNHSADAIAITGANSTLVFNQVIPPPELGAHRMSWRLMGQ